MSFGQSIARTCRELQQSWLKLADRAFATGEEKRQDDSARGEFMSAFISEGDLDFPRPDGIRRRN